MLEFLAQIAKELALQQNPLIGRPVNAEMRELVIGRDTHCLVALYSCIKLIDTVLVLAIQHAREARLYQGMAHMTAGSPVL